MKEYQFYSRQAILITRQTLAYIYNISLLKTNLIEKCLEAVAGVKLHELAKPSSS
jgi:hypothetical protein